MLVAPYAFTVVVAIIMLFFKVTIYLEALDNLYTLLPSCVERSDHSAKSKLFSKRSTKSGLDTYGLP
jgi:hypothetical protein